MLKSPQHVDITFDGVWRGLAHSLSADSFSTVFNCVEENYNRVCR